MKPFSAPALITERLFLNDITKQDASWIVTWRSNPEVYQYFLSPHPLKMEEHLEWFHTRYVLDENCFNWMAVSKDKGERIGVFGIKRRENNSASVEVSYILAPESQGKGYAKEALGKVIEFSKEEWGAREAMAEIHIRNKASVKFAMDLGFEYADEKGRFVLYRKKL